MAAMRTPYLCFCLVLVGFSSNSASGSSVVQGLCDRLVDRYNGFVDIVPLILPVKFPQNNEYFTGNAELFFYDAVNTADSPSCSLFLENNVKLLRIEVLLKIVIKCNEHRMTIDPARLTAHLRFMSPTSDGRLLIRPQLVDVQAPGNIFQDGIPVPSTTAEEILRPLLVKAFTGLAEEYLSYDDYLESAIFVDPSLATKLFRQVFLSYVTQL